jgi:hypothetical protein
MSSEQPAADTAKTTEPRRSGRIAANRPVQQPSVEVKAKAPRAVKKAEESTEAEGSTSKKVRMIA